ncbi:Sec-independent protein translocase protein TatB [Solimonas variicoloris]|uniref:Sec-independent protein translocase protein TatB n=1 Tax=Solimonas variicoloris TaxID=254408 RepID=UPI000361380B|nr:Sec-independent protein translocase protein TatB [Solimonas variicoloris]
MFEIGFSELLVCFLVALVVLGPEKLPKLARTVGRWTGQAKGYLRNLTAELDRESQLAELRKQLDEAKRAVQDGAESFKDSVQKQTSTLQASVQQEVDAARDAVTPTTDDGTDKKP